MTLSVQRWIKRFLKDTLKAGMVISLPVYAWVRLLFYEADFYPGDELLTLLKVILTGWLLMIAMKGCFYLLLAAAEKMSHVSFNLPRLLKWSTSLFAVILLSGLLYACNGQAMAGVHKDLTTGLTSTYKNIEPEKTVLVMNDEVLNHTDIPIGETFQIVNENVRGLKEKDGKVSVGCSLLITDKKGKKLLDIADLFHGKDLFNKDSVTYLKCTVSTGEPMEWEEHYDVTATFWDKYGTGKITNKVTIRMIDIP